MRRSLTLRPATIEDADLLLELRNEPSARANSFNQRPIDRAEHLAWMQSKLAQHDACRIWIAVEDGRAIGQARVDRTSETTGEISVAISLGARGRGTGALVIDRASELAFQQLNLDAISARVKPDNDASRRAFSRAGYSESATDEQGGEVVVVLERTACRIRAARSPRNA